MNTMAKTRRDTCAEIANQIADLLDEGVAPWRRPWSVDGLIPANASTGKPYRGINVLALYVAQIRSGYARSLWLTYKQAQAMGGQVRKGEKGTRLVFWKPTERRSRAGDGEETSTRGVVARSFTVFNVAQCDGLDLDDEPAAEVEGDDAADSLVAAYLASGPSLEHGSHMAAYSPSGDLVVMPPRDAFDSSAHYYATLFHELGHSTGHASRLARDLSGLFGDHSYSREELVAEFTAAFLCGLAGIDNDQTRQNAAAYLRCWAAKLREDPKILLWAASRAQKAVDLIVDAQAPAVQEAA